MIVYLQGDEPLQRAVAKGTHAADIKDAFKTTHTELLVTNYSRSHDRRKEKGKEEKSRQRIRLEEGNVGHAALMCNRKTCSHPPSAHPS